MGRAIRICLSLILMFSSPALAAQRKSVPPEVLADLAGGDKAYDAGNFAEACTRYSRALDACFKADPPPRIDRRMCGTAIHEATTRHYREDGNFVCLELMDKKHLAELARDMGAFNLHQISTIDNLAQLYDSQNEAKEAEKWLNRALTLAKGQKEKDTSLITQRTKALIEFHQKHKNNSKVEQLYEDQLAAIPGSNSSQQTQHETLARLYQQGGKFKEAEPHWQYLLGIGESTILKADCIYPGPNIFKEAFTALVENYLKQGQTTKAEQLCQKELTYKESQQRASKYYHPPYGNEGLEPVLSMLAKCYEAEHKYKNAEELYQRLLRIYEHSSGKEVLAIKQAYAALLTKMQRTEDAQAMNSFLLQAKEDKTRSEPLRSSAEVARWHKLVDQGRDATRGHNYKEAEEILQQALTLTNTFDPPGDYGCRTLYYLGENCYYQNHMDEAELFYRKALKQCETIYGREHSNCSLYVGGLSGMYWWQRKYDLAAPLYKRELLLEQKEQWPGSPELSTPKINLAQCLYMQGNKSEAMSLFNSAAASKQKWCRSNEAASTLKHIGTFLKSQNDLAESESFFARAKTLKSAE